MQICLNIRSAHRKFKVGSRCLIGGVWHVNGLALFFSHRFSVCHRMCYVTVSPHSPYQLAVCFLSLSQKALRINENLFSSFMLLRKDDLEIEDSLPCILRGKYAEIKNHLLEEIDSSMLIGQKVN